MGGKSTSQGAVLNGRGKHASGFDLHSWQGLTEVLRMGKESLNDSSAYAEFRNLVLEYAQQGGDPEIRKEIDKIIKTFGSQKKASENELHKKEDNQKPQHKKSDKQIQQQKSPPIAKPRRTKPAFKTPAVRPPHVPKKVVPPPRELPKEPVMPAEPKPKTDLPPVAAKKPQPPRPKEAPKVSNAGTQDNLNPEPIVRKSVEEHKQRISEIKRIVHEEIGNPATLVDSYNDLGRAYMMALLAALKSTGPGSGASPDTAMRALENAFKALREAPLNATEDTETKPTEPPVVPSEQPKEVVQKIPKPPRSVKKDVHKVETRDSVKQPAFDSKQKPRDKTIDVAQPKPVGQKKIAQDTVAKSVETQSHTVPKPVKKTQKAPGKNTSKPVLPPIRKAPTKGLEKRPSNPEKTTSRLSPIETLSSLLGKDDGAAKPKQKNRGRALHEIPPEKMATIDSEDIKKARTESSTPTPSETGYKPLEAVDTSPTVARQSELASPQVSEALHQLLDEWTLFKPSGLLGMGPGGHEHSLYKKLSTLSMGEVLSGRWEGADRESTSIIKEYVDAWRHEQGLAYNATETFEHYLRRVILRIQKRREQT